MGACSSKPKTTEFEGSTEPAKKVEDVIDRSTGTTLASEENEPIKGNDGPTDASKETAKGTSELIDHQNEAPLVKEPTSTAEGTFSSPERESYAVDGGAGGAVDRVGDNVRVAEKADTSDEIAKKDEEVAVKLPGEGGNVGVDQGKLSERKAVVLNESNNSDADEGGPYTTDKGMAAGEESSHGSPTVVGRSTADESRVLQNPQGDRGSGSPTTGVVQAFEPTHVDDVKDSVSFESPETATPVEHQVGGSISEASLSDIHRDKDVVPSEEVVVNLSSGLPREANKEEEEEVLHDDLKSSHPSANGSDGMGQKSQLDGATQCEEAPSASDMQGEQTVEEQAKPYTALDSADLQEEQTVEDAAKPYTALDSQNDPELRTSQPQEATEPAESARESQLAVMENESDSIALDGAELNPPKLQENIDDGASIKPTTETKAEEAGEGLQQAEDMVDKSSEINVLHDVMAEGDVKHDPVRTLGSVEPIVEASSQIDRDEDDRPQSAQIDRDEDDKPQIEVSRMNGEKMEDADAGKEKTVEQLKRKPTAEGDIAFEDASDVPLKVEPSPEVGG